MSEHIVEEPLSRDEDMRSKLRRSALSGSLSDDVQSLNAEVAHYLCDVLRLSVGDLFIGFDGAGSERVYRLERAGSTARGSTARGSSDHSTSESTSEKRELIAVGVGEPYAGRRGAPIGLCFALPKGDKLDLVARQITELGVSALYLWSAERSVGVWKAQKVKNKLERVERLCRAASRQSGRADELKVHAPVKLSALITHHAATPLKLYLDPHVTSGWPERDLKPSVDQEEVMRRAAGSSERELGCVMLVGPEGGLSSRECAELDAAGWRGMRLSSPVLRTETAGVVACAIALDRLGYLG